MKRHRSKSSKSQMSSDKATGTVPEDAIAAPCATCGPDGPITFLAREMDAIVATIKALQAENALLRQAIDVNAPGHAQSTIGYAFKEEVARSTMMNDECRDEVQFWTRTQLEMSAEAVLGDKASAVLEKYINSDFKETLKDIASDAVDWYMTDIGHDALEEEARDAVMKWIAELAPSEKS